MRPDARKHGCLSVERGLATPLLLTGQWPDFRRLRRADCFALFPQIAMLHHRRPRPRVRSTNRSVQVEPSHAFTYSKSPLHRNLAISSPIGSSRDSGVRQRRRVFSSQCESPFRGPGHDLSELFVAVEKSVQRFQIRAGRRRRAFFRSAP